MDGVRDEWYGEGIEDDGVDDTMKVEGMASTL